MTLTELATNLEQVKKEIAEAERQIGQWQSNIDSTTGRIDTLQKKAEAITADILDLVKS